MTLGGTSSDPSSKKPRLEEGGPNVSETGFQPKQVCNQLLGKLPFSLGEGGKARNSIPKLCQLFDQHGLRTSVIQSPREGLSVYKDSCVVLSENDDNHQQGKLFCVTMFGLHPQQMDIEGYYKSRVKESYCLMLFCQRLRQVIQADDEVLQSLLTESEQLFDKKTYVSVQERVRTLITAVHQVEPKFRIEQLEHEYERIQLWNCTFSNALVTAFQKFHDCQIKDIFFKASPHQAKFERITLYLYDYNLDHCKPPHFLFLPCLKLAIGSGPRMVVEEMIQSFWKHLLRHGYFATSVLKGLLRDDLQKFFFSGMTHNPKLPLQLNAHFNPNSALALYLHGKAGSGKSSLVRNFQPALEATIEKYLDPEILVRFVKQNLNKHYETLELELELRPNNNDLSVMSIIQGRRMMMGQSKPGLVVVALEEMPSNIANADPNQLLVSQLISQRFAGRNGNFSSRIKAPRNSDKRGIQQDASLITLFTSNYALELPCQDALQRLAIFQHLSKHEIIAVSGQDRVDFARSYINQCLEDQVSIKAESAVADFQQLDVPLGEGDTRPLVRHLRMIAFYISQLISQTKNGLNNHPQIVSVVQKNGICKISVGSAASIVLKIGSQENLFPLTPLQTSHRPLVDKVIACLKGNKIGITDLSELAIILNFWLAKTLAPAVILSKDANKIRKLMDAVTALETIHSLTKINADEYKMMKSLYDPTNTPNLRDDILSFGRGAFVAIELQCLSADAQLCIREIIEDSPSMTAFSTSKSALYKSGLLFSVHVNGKITPELISRASIII